MRVSRLWWCETSGQFTSACESAVQEQTVEKLATLAGEANMQRVVLDTFTKS